jgi:hypothetical protein
MAYETIPPPVRSVLYMSGLSVPVISKPKLLAEKPPEKNVSASHIVPVEVSVYPPPPQLMKTPGNEGKEGGGNLVGTKLGTSLSFGALFATTAVGTEEGVSDDD